MSSKPAQLVTPDAKAAPIADVRQLVDAYYTSRPDPAVTAQRVLFGTSGHRGTSLDARFNEAHVLAITQAICEYRKAHGVDGPLYIGVDTHALSMPAFQSAVEVLAANAITTLVSAGDEFTPTPAVSHAILAYNRGRTSGLADGIVVTPSHNPPESGGFKYNACNGGPADTRITKWIEGAANALLDNDLKGVRRMPFDRARRAATTREHDFLTAYVNDLDCVIDFAAIRAGGLHIGVDPMGGAGVHYWPRIAQRYGLDLTVVNDKVDPTFSFMPVDWDGRIRMDPSSRYAMRHLTDIADRFDIAFACDTDHDRHGIVTRSEGLVPPNHYLAVSIDYLVRNRHVWKSTAAIGKTVVSSAMIDRVTARLDRKLHEVPVGFKWFVDGLFDGTLCFAGEESAGAAFSRIDGTVWTTDKDGIVPALLAAEMTARSGRDPSQLYRALTSELGNPVADRLEAPATAVQRQKLALMSAKNLRVGTLAGEPVLAVLDHAPGNNAPIGGIKVTTENAWFAARPSGTEDIYKIYVESFRGADHMREVAHAAQEMVDRVLKES